MVRAARAAGHAADPATIAAFLVDEAERGIAASTIDAGSRRSGYVHKLAEHPDPTGHPDVTETLKGIRRRTSAEGDDGSIPASGSLETQYASPWAMRFRVWDVQSRCDFRSRVHQRRSYPPICGKHALS